MAEGVLHSDHINYLVLRYLQEKGHEAAATAFYTEWRRPSEYRDPENLPFAPAVRRDELISVIQEGVHHDELSARVRSGNVNVNGGAEEGSGVGEVAMQRRFRWLVGSSLARSHGSAEQQQQRQQRAIAGAAGVAGASGSAATLLLENGSATAGPSSSSAATSGSGAPAVLRPSSSGKRKGRPPGLRAGARGEGEDFPLPQPKRQRRSDGDSEGGGGGLQMMNGDRGDAMMEIDAASAEANGDEDGEAASPANASPDPEIIEVPERYDSMDVATQTEVKGRVKTSTMYWKLGKPGAVILRGLWRPTLDPGELGTFLTVGESVHRFYLVPGEISDNSQVPHIEDPFFPKDSIVSTCIWHPAGQMATCAVEVTRGGIPQTVLVDYSPDVGSAEAYLDMPHLDGGNGIVMTLQYNPDGQYLLVARTNGTRGLVLIYPTTGSVPTSSSSSSSEGKATPKKEPIAWEFFDFPIYDAAWTDNERFIVGGRSARPQALRLKAEEDLVKPASLPEADGNGDAAANGSAKSHETAGIRKSVSLFAGAEFSSWDKVRACSRCHGVAAVCLEQKRLVMTSTRRIARATADGDDEKESSSMTSSDDSVERSVTVGQLSGNVTAMEFQPPSSPSAAVNNGKEDSKDVDGNDNSNDDNSSRTAFLAVASEEGTCEIYEFDSSWADEDNNSNTTSAQSQTTTPPSLACTLQLAQEPALALAWSPQGDYLAVGGPYIVQIWKASELLTTQRPIVTWRPEEEASSAATSGGNGVAAGRTPQQQQQRNGEKSKEEEGDVAAEDERPLSEPSLSWSADGQSLSFAVDEQIAIIRFRPPLETPGRLDVVNGFGTP